MSRRSSVMVALISLSIVVCIFSSFAEAAPGRSTAQNDLDFSSEDITDPVKVKEILLRFGSELETMEEEDYVGEVAETSSVLKENDANGHCSYSGLTCQCCQFVSIPKIGLRNNCCVAVAYFPGFERVSINITLGSITLFQGDYPIYRIHRICVMVGHGAKACFELYNVHLSGLSLSACTRVTFYLFAPVARFNLGCFRFAAIDGETGLIESDEMTDMAVLKDAESPKVLLFNLFKALHQMNGIEAESYDNEAE